MGEVTKEMVDAALRAIDELHKARIEEQKWEPANQVPCPTEVEEMQVALEVALTTAQAENEALKERTDALALQADEWEGKYAAVSEINEALRELLRECQDKMGDIVMGEGLHPDDAAVLHAKIASLSGSKP